MTSPPASPRHLRRRRRGTMLTVVVTALAIGAAGLVVATRAGPDPRETTAAETGQAGSDPDPGPAIGVDQLLSKSQIARLDQTVRWRLETTGTRPPRAAAYASCNAARYADPRNEAAYVQSFTTAGGGRAAQLVVQAVEVSSTASAASAASRRLLRWYAGCQVPRIQLLDSFSLRRPGTDVAVLELRRWSDPVRSITLALARTGVASTVLVHEVEGPDGPPRPAVGRSVVDALAGLCRTDRRECAGDPTPRPVPLPATGEGRGFLGAVDLPPVAELRTPWVGTAPARAGPGVTATLCDPAAFAAEDLLSVRARAFVFPGERLPSRFGLSQAVGVLRAPAAAERFVEQATARIASCPQRQLSVSVGGTTTVRAGDVRGWVTRLTYELAGGEVFQRVGLVHSGPAVSQLVFSPTGRLDVGPAAYEALVLRAGERLGELPRR